MWIQLSTNFLLYSPKNLWETFIYIFYNLIGGVKLAWYVVDASFFSLWNLRSDSMSLALHNTAPTWPLTYKLTIALLFLIAVRGALPRYRYDFLTKLGWVKFLGQTLTFLLTTVTIIVSM